MKTLLSSQTLLVVIASFWASFCAPAAARGQITFVRTPEGTNSPANTRQVQQTRQSQQAQQSGLSPDKKKSLSKYGPEDAFPGATEQEDRQRQTNRTNQRRSGALSNQPTAPASIPTSTPTATSLPTPSSTQIAATPQPSSSPVMATGSTDLASNLTTQPPTGQSSGSTLLPVSLATAALLVFGALVYVVGSLRKKLKGS